jgi:predicted amidohydrolase YtcJ
MIRLAPAFLLLAIIPRPMPAQTQAPDLILFHGKIFTADPKQPWADSIAIKGDRIAAVGAKDAILKMAGPSTKRIDLGTRTVIPGFNDAHTQISAFLPAVDLTFPSPDPSWEEVIRAVALAASFEPGTEVLHGLIGQTAWQDAKASRVFLDRVAPNRPVFLITPSGHNAVLNTAYLRCIGLREDAPDPPLGKYDRLPGTSHLTGRSQDYPLQTLKRRESFVARNPQDPASLATMADPAYSVGITSVQDLSLDGAAHAASVWRDSKLPTRVREMYFPFSGTACEDDPLVKQRRPVLPQHISISGCAWILDGEPLDPTSARKSPYPGPGRITSRLNFSDAQVRQMVQSAESRHQQLLFEATVPKAVEQLLRILETTPNVDWKSRRVRMEHGDAIEPGQMDRIRRLGVIVVQNPPRFRIPTAAPPQLTRAMFPQPVATLLKHHVTLAFGSGGPWNPFENLQLAVDDQWQPAESISREQAVVAYTYGSAYAEFEEQTKGRLTVGQKADFAILSQDIFTIPVQKIGATRSVLTMIGGTVVHDDKVVHIQ